MAIRQDTKNFVASLLAERTLQSNYWKEHSVNPSVETMMLDSQAPKLDLEERPEILSLLPPYKGKDVIELGAGIGRFTGDLAKSAGHVLAMDFMENLIKKNEDVHGHMNNIDFKCADVTSPQLDISSASADLVFSNWLLMSLSDEEVEGLTSRIIEWLRPGGFIFFRESCFHHSCDNKWKNNPTHYRQPSYYTQLFEQTHIQEEDGSYYEFELVERKCVGTYVRNKNQNQVCWLWKKVPSLGPEVKSFQQFLDTQQYTATEIMQTTKEFANMLDLKPGQRVLVGCGIGGSDFYMSEEYDAEVVGIDLSVNMISFALERSIGRKCAIEFEVGDCTKINYPEASFDVIYSRDTILHIQVSHCPPFFISDYCRAPGTPSEQFASYIKQRNYDLHSVQTYGQMLQRSGFIKVHAEDGTDQFVEVLKRELSATEQERDKFIEEFSEDDYNYIVNGWKSKLERCANDEQKWGLFVAHKPL
uniref:phosphoethanolamine N-methyltransferase n=1 Tax=Physcomitrium patens TaxID=3218 RepID=A0A2K1JL44_PHYPA|nr:hypothetical protein PHYPA_016925 [Physcomitrium patens]